MIPAAYRTAHLDVGRHDRLGGILHQYEHRWGFRQEHRRARPAGQRRGLSDQPGLTSPDSYAATTSCARSRAYSLVMMRET
jgi:hypothetical protein